MNKMKNQITEKKNRGNKKYSDVQDMNNYNNLCITSNDDEAVPLTIENARFFCLNVQPIMKGEKEYFDRLQSAFKESNDYFAYILNNVNIEINGLAHQLPHTEDEKKLCKMYIKIWKWKKEVQKKH